MPNISQEQEFITLWMQVSRLVRRRMHEAWRTSGVNPLQLYALSIIHDHIHLTMKEFAQLMHSTSPSATALIVRLAKLKWVQRVQDPQNRKLVRLRLTPSGEEVLSQKMHLHGTMIMDMLSMLPEEDRTAFARILRHLHHSLSQEK